MPELFDRFPRYPSVVPGVCALLLAVMAGASVITGVTGEAGAVAGFGVFVIAVGTAGQYVLARRAVRAARTPEQPVTLSRVRRQQGVSSRSYVEIEGIGEPGDGPLWQPVFFEVEHLTVPQGAVVARVTDRGGRMAMVTGEGVRFLPSGRPLSAAPGGKLVDAPRLEGKSLERRRSELTLRRRILLDAMPATPAPVVGVMWVAVNGGGVDEFVVATIIAATVGFWATVIMGSDPS